MNIEKLNFEQWQTINTNEAEILINHFFKGQYTISSKVGNGVVFSDHLNIEWILAPAYDNFPLGMSQEEKKLALSLSDEPFLSFDEMPVSVREIKPFLIMKRPLTVEQVTTAKEEAHDWIEENKIAILQEEQVDKLCEYYEARLPLEFQWEYACRGGIQKQLFSFGNTLPNEKELSKIFGFHKSPKGNNLGLESLYFGEICEDLWTTTSDEYGRIVKGGAGRFWPWHDSREWAGAVSAFRMSYSSTGGMGVCLRLIRNII